MNKEIVDLWFNRYPKLETLLCAGTISKKAVREIILVDRYDMDRIYYDLLEAEAVQGAGSGMLRATKELKEYVQERRKDEREEI